MSFLSRTWNRLRWGLLVLLIGGGVLTGGIAFVNRPTIDPSLTVTVRKGTLTAQLTTTGILRPIQSITYRSPLTGRELEITDLVPEGTRVNEGDLLVRLDTTELRRDLDRARQEVRQSRMELQVADIERDDAEATVKTVSEGEGALTVEEARVRQLLMQKKVERLRQEYEQLKPLMDKGFITREELRKTSDELEQVEEELTLARRRTDVVAGLTHPRDQQRATLQLAQKTSQLENVRAKVLETEARFKVLLEQIESSSLYARRPGMVVYEEFLNASPRRKVRIGDRVTGSQGLVTIPEVTRMLLEASVSEAEIHRVKPGQAAAVRAEAFPGLRLTGTVVRVGTLARVSADRPLDDKRFDLIVELDPTDADLRPEMTGRADIIVSTRPDVLLIPVNAIFEQQGTLVAHVVGRFSIETRPIAVGESNDAVVEIASGLHEGEQVALTDPRTGAVTVPVGAPAPGSKRSAIETAGGNGLQPR